MENRRLIRGLKTGSYLFVCFSLSIVYIGEGFIYAFSSSLLPKNISDTKRLFLSVISTIVYAASALSTGYFISYGRRLTLLVADIVCICVMPFIMLCNETVDLVFYCGLPLFEGCWIVTVFVYGKDESVVHQASFAAVFMQLMNTLGLIVGDLLQLFNVWADATGKDRTMFARICVLVGMASTSLIQVVLFLGFIRREPIRYEFEESGEEYVYDSLNELITDKKSIERIVRSLKRTSNYKKFVGIKYLSLFSKYYRGVFLTCLGLYALKGAVYFMSLGNRMVERMNKHRTAYYFTFNAVAKAALTLIGLFAVRYIQRKTQFIVGYFFYGLSCLAALVLAISYIMEKSMLNSLLYMISVAVTEYFYFGLLSYLPYVMSLELLPDKGVALTIAFYTIYSNVLANSMSSFGKYPAMKCVYFGVGIVIAILGSLFASHFLKYTRSNDEDDSKREYLEEHEDLQECLSSRSSVCSRYSGAEGMCQGHGQINERLSVGPSGTTEPPTEGAAEQQSH